MSKAVVFLADGFEECEGLLAVDLLRRAGCAVDTASISKQRQITSSHGVCLMADALADEVDFSDVDMIVLPGGMPGTSHLAGSSVVAAQCRAFAADPHKWVAAICAAPSVLGENGLLHGRKYTCYPGFENDEKYHGTYTAAPLQQDGKIVTANGAGNAMTFALYLLAALQGEEKALEVARSIQMKL